MNPHFKILLILFLILSSCQDREWNNIYDTNNTLIKSLPVISGVPVKVATFSSAISGGSIISAGGSPITAKGVCWSSNHNPTLKDYKTFNGAGIDSFKSVIGGLTINTTYYVRTYATNSLGTAYSDESSVILYMNVPDASITDIDGNVYKTVKIGSQVWMAENLKVTKYRDGSAIPNVTDGATWVSLASGAYCDWINNASYGVIYGHLYNFYSVIDSRKISPVGWHVPTDAEWTVLSNYLGGDNVAGGKLKEVGTTHWDSPNTSADNSSGFTAFAGSWRGDDGSFYYWVRTLGDWWSCTQYDSNNGIFRTLNASSAFGRSYGAYFGKKGGCSIRCLKD